MGWGWVQCSRGRAGMRVQFLSSCRHLYWTSALVLKTEGDDTECWVVMWNGRKRTARKLISRMTKCRHIDMMTAPISHRFHHGRITISDWFSDMLQHNHHSASYPLWDGNVCLVTSQTNLQHFSHDPCRDAVKAEDLIFKSSAKDITGRPQSHGLEDSNSGSLPYPFIDCI